MGWDIESVIAWTERRLRRLEGSASGSYHGSVMAFPIKVCAVCSEEFELKPGKPGFANRCPACSEPEADEPGSKGLTDALDRKSASEANAARREAMKNLLYRKDS